MESIFTAHKHVISDSLLALRSYIVSNRFDDFWQRRAATKMTLHLTIETYTPLCLVPSIQM